MLNVLKGKNNSVYKETESEDAQIIDSDYSDSEFVKEDWVDYEIGVMDEEQSQLYDGKRYNELKKDGVLGYDK